MYTGVHMYGTCVFVSTHISHPHHHLNPKHHHPVVYRRPRRHVPLHIFVWFSRSAVLDTGQECTTFGIHGCSLRVTAYKQGDLAALVLQCEACACVC